MDILGFLIQQNGSWPVQMQFCDDTPAHNPIPMNGCQFHLKSASGLIDLSTAAGTMTFDASTSKLNWEMTPAQTGAIPVPVSFPQLMPDGSEGLPLDTFELLVKWPNGQVYPTHEGPLFLGVGQPF